jgi:extradiol dioxygenase family protein
MQPLCEEKKTWVKGIGHLALVVSDVAKAKYFFEEVLGCKTQLWRETQLLVFLGSDILVAKLSKDAVNSEHQLGEFGKQVMDHYGFQASCAEDVDLFFKHIEKHKLVIVKPPYSRSDGRAFYFKDPFNNLVEYFWYSK